jgi:hypothetical protein
LRAIAAGLNAQGIPTAKGSGQWSAVQVARVLERICMTDKVPCAYSSDGAAPSGDESATRESMKFERYAGMASAIGLVLILLIVTWLGLWAPIGSTTWTDAGEFIKVLGSIATGGAAVTGAAVAWRGLEKWRSETTGKTKAELAATVLAEFYEMAEILRAARNPFVLNHEMAAKEGVPDSVASDSSYAPEARLLEHQAFFGRFRSRKHEFAAVFGRTAAQPFDDIWRIRLEINWAVDGMLRHKEIRNDRDPENRTLWLSWYNVAFRDADEKKDVLLPRIDAAVIAIEATCRPAIDASRAG